MVTKVILIKKNLYKITQRINGIMKSNNLHNVKTINKASINFVNGKKIKIKEIERKMKKAITTVNSRQWKLYKYLCGQEDPKTLETIIRETGLYGPVDEINFNNSAGRRVLTADIRILKEKDEPHKNVLSTNQGIIIGTKKEFIQEIGKQERKLIKMFQLLNKQKRKAGLDNQLRLVFGKEKEIIEAFKGGTL